MLLLPVGLIYLLQVYPNLKVEKTVRETPAYNVSNVEPIDTAAGLVLKDGSSALDGVSSLIK